jgi:hypothetical protein
MRALGGRPVNRDVAEAVCSVTEPAPGVFHVLLTHNGRPEIRRLMQGIDLLVSWSEGVKARLQVGWVARSRCAEGIA